VNQQLLLSGNLAAYPNSCSGMGNLSKKAVEAGLNLGVAFYPTYDVENHVTMIGGCNVSIIKDGTETEETINASWEFIKFLMADAQVATVHLETGYIPVTKSAVNDPSIKAKWTEDPRWEIAYDQAMKYGKCQETPVNTVGSDYLNVVVDTVSVLIQENAITPEEAVQSIIDESADLW
jgi:ABC-type glycerol-3-phosphate transport system substrate-binding protein